MGFLMFQEELIPIAIGLVFLVIGLAFFAVWVWSLIDVIRSDFKGENDKLIWILVIVLAGILGSVIYFFVGRKNKI